MSEKWEYSAVGNGFTMIVTLTVTSSTGMFSTLHHRCYCCRWPSLGYRWARNFEVLCVWFLAGLDVGFRDCESSAPLSES